MQRLELQPPPVLLPEQAVVGIDRERVGAVEARLRDRSPTVMMSLCSCFTLPSTVRRTRVASQSSNSGCVGASPRRPKSPGVATSALPKWCIQTRLTNTRAVSGLSFETIALGQFQPAAAVRERLAVGAGDLQELPRHRLAGPAGVAAVEDARVVGSRRIVQHHRPRRPLRRASSRARAGASGTRPASRDRGRATGSPSRARAARRPANRVRTARGAAPRRPDQPTLVAACSGSFHCSIDSRQQLAVALRDFLHRLRRRRERRGHELVRARHGLRTSLQSSPRTRRRAVRRPRASAARPGRCRLLACRRGTAASG